MVGAQLTNELLVALTAQDQVAFAAALPNAEVAVLLRPPTGTGAVNVKIDNQGRRNLLVFSAPDTLRLWAPDASYGILKGSDLPTLAKELSIDVVCFDVAGPVPVEIDPPHLDALLDGIFGESGGTRLVGEFLTTPNLQLARLLRAKVHELDLPNEYLIFPTFRETPNGLVATLYCDSNATAQALARALPRLIEPGNTVDVVVVNSVQMASLQSRFDEIAICATKQNPG